MAAIGSILVDGEMLDVVSPIIQPNDFYAHVHETIFRVIIDLAEERKPIDKISLAERLLADGKLDKVGGLPYLTSLMDTVPTAASAEYYATIVREKALLRGLIRVGGQIARLGFEGENDAAGALQNAERMLRPLLERDVAGKGAVDLQDALRANYIAMTEIAYGVRPSNAILTPWHGVNELIGGLFGGELVIWGAAPKMGKTGAVVNLADYIAATTGTVVYACLEMGTPATTRRELALYSGVSARRQRLGELDERDIEAIGEAQAKLISRERKGRIKFLDLQTCSRVSDLRTLIRIISRETKPVALVVDHVNFFTDAQSGARDTKHNALDRVYMSLIAIGQEFDLVVHAVQHVNRAGYEGRPSPGQLRDGGNPEGHAHAIIMPYRPNPLGTPEERKVGEFIVALAREGDAGIAPMKFIGHRALWLDADEDVPWFEKAEHRERADYDGAIA